MGSQGQIYVVYGVQLDAKCEWEAAPNTNPVIYSINGHTLCDDEDFMGRLNDGTDPLPAGVSQIEFYNGIPSAYYGASDLKSPELVMQVLGHSGEYGQGNMGARHFTKGFGGKIGEIGKALVGFVVASEAYITRASELPPMNKIEATAPRLIGEIERKLGVAVKPSELGLHLFLESMNGL